MMKHIDKRSWPQQPWSKRNWAKPRWMGETGPKCGMQRHLQWFICKDWWFFGVFNSSSTWNHENAYAILRYAVHLLSGMEQWSLRSLSVWLLHESQEIEELRLIGEARFKTVACRLCGKDTPIYPHVCTYPLLVPPLSLMNDACVLSLKKKQIVSGPNYYLLSMLFMLSSRPLNTTYQLPFAVSASEFLQTGCHHSLTAVSQPVVSQDDVMSNVLAGKLHRARLQIFEA